MLQIDHVYEFLYQELFKDFGFWYLPNGIPKLENINLSDISIFTLKIITDKKIMFYDQEPFIPFIYQKYMDILTWEDRYTVEELIKMIKSNKLPYGIPSDPGDLDHLVGMIGLEPTKVEKVLVTSEISKTVDQTITQYGIKKLYYFFHGFAALDWYRGFYALNYNKSIVKEYKHDYITFNRIINHDRSYRIYFVSKLAELGLLNHGQISFNVTDNLFDDWRDEVSDLNTKLSLHAQQHAKHHLTDISKLIIDGAELPGSASADIPRTIDCSMHPDFPAPPSVDAFWHIVTETVFYYNKLHLTEKIFKPIVSKQPFMLLAAPGNLAYLKSYGFKTFDSVIDESYDSVQDPDLRIEAVVKQLHWYCNLTPSEKTDIIRQLEPIILHNFDHFYGEFRHIITRELLDNTKAVFHEIGYDDSHINYTNIHHVLTH
jgi:hypothetical protein